MNESEQQATNKVLEFIKEKWNFTRKVKKNKIKLIKNQAQSIVKFKKL